MIEFLHSLPLLVKAALMGIVEGATEFLPISSTGHLILAGSLLGFTGEKAKVFEIAIQTGAMFAIMWLYRERIARVLAGLASDRTAQRFALNVVVASIPAVVVGLAVGKLIKQHLFKPVPVAIAFIVGALIILWVERRGRPGTERPARIQHVDDMTALDAFKVGVAQLFALVPGMSRSGSTIIGGMLFGLSRPVATEFSFFLAIPILIGAGAHDVWKSRGLLEAGDVPLFATGLVVSFIAALVCVRWLVRYVAGHTFVPFAWYRIVFGILVLATAGTIDWSD